MKDHYNVIGLMSGTSLDGLDICYVTFRLINGNWTFELNDYQTVNYSSELKSEITQAVRSNAFDLNYLDKKLGQLYGKHVRDFIQSHNIEQNKIDFIASHGQTIFHQPDKGLTVQIGCGETLAKETNIEVINDFRTKDVLHGGQGAPLVPKGDFELFKTEADAFLNIGGFANISFKFNDEVLAFDIAPANIILNPIAEKLGAPFDNNGAFARKGALNNDLLNALNSIPEYQIDNPNSLGTEWIQSNISPILDKVFINEFDLLRTVTTHVAHQIARRINHNKLEKVFITGGGAFNSFLIELIQNEIDAELIIPSKPIIEYKEALIFAFLGVLRKLELPNCLKSVTGADSDVCGGVIHIP